MTTGALIFAFDNEKIDYVGLAAWAADRVHRHLDIPVCVVTDSQTQDPRFDKIIRVQRSVTDQQRRFGDLDSNVTWYNQDRVDSYDLSPWDQTLVMDADYVVASSNLSTMMRSSRPFLCHRSAWDIATGGAIDHLNKFGRNGMPMWWATVMIFRRDPVVQLIFDSMRMVRDNWHHYKALYGIGRSAYRNDFALSIALTLVNGHSLSVDCLPWNLATLLPEHTVQALDQDSFRIGFRCQDKTRHINIDGMDFHAMGKAQLGDIVADKS